MTQSRYGDLPGSDPVTPISVRASAYSYPLVLLAGVSGVMMARIKGGTLSKFCFSAEQKVRSQYCGCELKNTRKALPESLIVGLCLIFELELDIDFDLKVLIGTKRTSKNWET